MMRIGRRVGAMFFERRFGALLVLIAAACDRTLAVRLTRPVSPSRYYCTEVGRSFDLLPGDERPIAGIICR